MPAPKIRTSKGRKNRRRAHLNAKLSKPALVTCAKCGKVKKPHTICKSCETY